MATEPQRVEAEEAAAEPFNADDRESVNKARKRAASRHREQLEVVALIMGAMCGRAWMYDKLLACSITASPYSRNAYDTAFNCGAQNIGLLLLADVQAASP